MPKELQNTTRTFLIESADMCIHIITTGFSQRQKYMVVFEDGYKEKLGETVMLSSTEIKDRFNIIL